MEMKKALFFTVDALIAASIMILAIILSSHTYVQEKPKVDIGHISEDIIRVLSELRVGELNDSYIKSLINNGNITDTNNTVLEQIGEFWAEGKDSLAQNFTRHIFENLVPPYNQYSYGIWIDNQQIDIKNLTEASSQVSYRKFVSGIERGKPIEGFISKVYLKGIDTRHTSSFAYFGGFVGEGKITQRVILPKNFTNTTIQDAYMEMDAGTDFKLYINGKFAGDFPKGSGGGGYMVPDRWNISPAYFSYFTAGANNITINFTYINENASAEGPKYIAGGYFRVTYNTPTNEELVVEYHNTTATTKYWFPGIEGFINLFSSFYVPGHLNNMKIYFHYNSSYTTFLKIGNTTVFENNSNGHQTEFIIENSTIATALLNNNITYDDLSLKTTPIRVGMENVSKTTAPADIVLVTDTSGSMEWCTQQTELECYTNCLCGPCSSGGGTCGSQICGIYSTCGSGDVKKIDAAKNASNTFIDRVLAHSGPLIGLISYDSSTNNNETHSLSNNKSSLHNTVNNYTAGGGTCICCGINSAVDILRSDNISIIVSRKSDGWKYNDDDLPSPPTNWYSISFDDSSWKSGTGVFRNDYWWLGEPHTTLNKYEGDYYFRKKFNITNASKIKNAKLYVLSDNGADIYLNGNLIDNDYNGQPNGGASYWDREVNVDVSYFQDGENIIAARNYNRQSCIWFFGWICWATDVAFDLELVASVEQEINETRQKAMVVMSDGQATVGCGGDPAQDAIDAACDAYNDYGIKVYAVGFGKDADNDTLSAIAQCGHGSYYKSDDLDELIQVYEDIANEIISFTETQIANASGIIPSVLYHDSYIEFNFTPVINPLEYGRISVTVEGNRFDNNISQGTIFIPGDVILSDLKATSYSADKWTDNISVYNGESWSNIFRLSEYGNNYQYLGDAYLVTIPPTAIRRGINNTVVVSTGIDPNNSTGGSIANRLIYTVRIRNNVGYSDVYPKAEGCNWTVKFEDGTTAVLQVPSNYNGSSVCYFENRSFDGNDSINQAVFKLFSQLDFDGDGELTVKIGKDDVAFDSASVANVPSMWGPAILEVRIWT